MKLIVISSALLLGISLNAQEDIIITNSIDILNLTNLAQDIEVNDKSYQLNINHSLNIPCSKYDEIKLQYFNNIEYVPCGYTKELK